MFLLRNFPFLGSRVTKSYIGYFINLAIDFTKCIWGGDIYVIGSRSCYQMRIESLPIPPGIKGMTLYIIDKVIIFEISIII